jgi:hypothetical protein
VGTITRGTTAPNRLRRVDRWLLHAWCGPLRRAADPLVVDLGYGAAPVTTVELAARLRAYARPDVDVLGVEIDPERVAAAAPFAGPGLGFRRGGFEVPGPEDEPGRRPFLVRALNVLRQYDEQDVGAAWRALLDRVAPGGGVLEGTCDEVGRRVGLVCLHADDARGPGGVPVPRTLTLAAHLASLDRPSDLAERLPKALIHHHVPGEPVHDLLAALDRAWASAAPYGTFGPRQRWVAAVSALASSGVPVLDGRSRWRLGEITVPWTLVAPASDATSLP